jgi:hypothetical protein
VWHIVQPTRNKSAAVGILCFIILTPTVSNIGDPDVIMQEESNSSQGGYIHRPVVRLPLFWPDRPGLWFAQAEAQCNLAAVTSERTKFNYGISQPEYRHPAKVEDIIISPPIRRALHRSQNLAGTPPVFIP